MEETKVPQPTAEATSVTAEQTKVETAPASTPFKVFATEEEFTKAVQSERSKAKNEVLKEVGAKNLDELKGTIATGQTVAQEVSTYKAKAAQLEEQLAVAQVGVLPEYINEALVLAKAQTDKPLKDALASVIQKFPTMAHGSPKGVEAIGGEAKPKVEQHEGTFNKQLTSKYPWIKI